MIWSPMAMAMANLGGVRGAGASGSGRSGSLPSPCGGFKHSPMVMSAPFGVSGDRIGGIGDRRRRRVCVSGGEGPAGASTGPGSGVGSAVGAPRSLPRGPRDHLVVRLVPTWRVSSTARRGKKPGSMRIGRAGRPGASRRGPAPRNHRVDPDVDPEHRRSGWCHRMVGVSPEEHAGCARPERRVAHAETRPVHRNTRSCIASASPVHRDARR